MVLDHLACRPRLLLSALAAWGLLLCACGGEPDAPSESGSPTGAEGASGAGERGEVESAADDGEATDAVAIQDAAAASGGGADPLAPNGAIAVGDDADPMTWDLSGLDEPVAAKVAEAREVVRLDPTDPDRWRDLAHTYQANRIPGLAIAAYQKALDLDGEDARLWYQLALAQHSAEDLGGAMTSVEAALARDATVPAYHWRRANWLFDLGRIDQAAEGFRAALALAPDDPAAVAGMARVQMDADDLEPATEALARILVDADQMPFANYVRKLLATAYRRNGELERAGALEAIGTDGLPIWYDPAEIEVARFAVETVFHRAARAVELANQGNFDAAIVEMRAVVEDDPSEAARRNQLARFLDLAGREEEAIAEYRETLERTPNEREALVQLGKLLGQRGDHAEGLALLEQAIEVQPLYPPAHFYRGSILRRAGELEAAAAAYRRSVELDETKKTPWIAVGLLELQLEQWESALQAFERALELGLDRGDVWLGKAECLLQLGRLDEAQEALDAGRMKSPFDTKRWMGVSVSVQNERRKREEAAGGQGR